MILKKRFVWLFIAVLSFSLAFSGCGSSSDTPVNNTTDAAVTPASGTTEASGQPADITPTEISVFISDPGQQAPTPDNAVYKMIQEKLGVTFQWDFLVGDKDQKIGVMIAGGDYPDLLFVDTYSNPKFMSAGALIPLDDLMKNNAPNLYAHYKPVWNIAKNPEDGKFYIMANYGVLKGTYQAPRWEGSAFWIQKAVLADAGYPAPPKTLDEYFSLIENYMAKNPTIEGQPTIGFETLCEGWRDFCLKHPPEHLMGRPNDGDTTVVNGKCTSFWDTNEAKVYYKKLNEEMQKGIIDPEFFSLTYDQYIAKLSSGAVLGLFDQHWDFGNNAELNLANANKDERTWIPCELTLPGYKPYYQDQPVVNVNTGFAITKSCKDPERVIKLFDTLMTEEWQKILGWGLPGKDYTVGSDGKFTLTTEQSNQNNDTAYRLANRAYTLWYYGPKMEGTYSDGNATSPGLSPEVFYNGLHQYDKDFMAKYNRKTWAEFLTPAPPNPISYPLWQIDKVAGSLADVAWSKYNDVGTKYLPRLILAEPDKFDSMWTEYVDSLHKIDLKPYYDRIDSQLQWREKNWAPNAE
ncbi:MAG TPA: extracellular solute-binding protein [Clostridia bacterium]|nr:extracellular solute-binding protein [Clostridia bacterium]